MQMATTTAKQELQESEIARAHAAAALSDTRQLLATTGAKVEAESMRKAAEEVRARAATQAEAQAVAQAEAAQANVEEAEAKGQEAEMRAEKAPHPPHPSWAATFDENQYFFLRNARNLLNVLISKMYFLYNQ